MIIILNTISSLMYICLCNAITEGQMKACVESGACTLEDLASQLGVGSGCGRCQTCATQVMEETRARVALSATP
jgi:bacterioferritin-associated ferredoxin